MLLKEIFSDEQETTEIQNFKINTLFENKPQKMSLKRSLCISIIIHSILFGLLFLIAQVLVYILMFFGIDLGLFQRPSMKIRDIEFVFTIPEKYDIKKSFVKNVQGKEYSLAGPKPNNRPYNAKEGSLKSKSVNKSVPKDKIVNQKPIKDTKATASQTTTPASVKQKKGNYIPPIEVPDVFTANIPNAEIDTEIGFGLQGKNGIHSPNAGNATFKAAGEGSGGSGEGDSVGAGTIEGGGYYYGNAGAPRPQSANQYKNESLDVDLRPYVTELQRRVLRNWAMPSNDNNKKTILFLRISKSGNLMILNVKTPSGDTYIDQLAITAVKKAQPFSPLPADYRNAYADIILTFDYNVSAREN